jgi:hypothetical protein
MVMGTVVPDTPEKKKTCENYASTAVTQQKKNLATCNLKGHEWKSRYDDHYNWCMQGENHKRAQQETYNRQAKLDGCSVGECPQIIPGMTLGLRHEQVNNKNDPFRPDKHLFAACNAPLRDFSTIDYKPRGMDRLAIGSGMNWLWKAAGTVVKDAHFKTYPPGIAVGLSGDEFTEPTAFGEKPYSGPEYLPGGNFKKMTGGDMGRDAGTGLYWYESTGLGFTDWSMVSKLPRGTMIGLRHTHNNRGNTSLTWRGRTIDATNPSIPPPQGFVRKFGGDMGMSSGQGYYWYEKITGR